VHEERIDTTQYGASATFEREGASFFAACAYKMRSGLGAGIGAAMQFIVPFIGLSITFDKKGPMLCGTSVRSIGIDVGALLFHASIMITIATGRRNDKLVDALAGTSFSGAMTAEDWKPTSYQYGGPDPGSGADQDAGAGSVSGKY